MSWKMETDNIFRTVWRNTVDTSLTVEVHILKKYELDNEEIMYYVFPARDGRGIPNSPALFIEKEEAIEHAEDLMEE